MKGGAMDGLREKCQLLPRASRHSHEVCLIGVSEPRPDHHFAPLRVPVGLKSSTILRVSPDCFRQGLRNLGNALRHQAFWRSNRVFLCRRVNSNSDKQAQFKHESFHRGTLVLEFENRPNYQEAKKHRLLSIVSAKDAITVHFEASLSSLAPGRPLVEIKSILGAR